MARRVASARDIDESPRYAAGKLMLRNAPARTCVMTAPQKYRTRPLPWPLPAAIPSGFARSPARSPTAPATFTAPNAGGHESGTPTSRMNLSTNCARVAVAAPIPPVAAAVTTVTAISTAPGVAATMWVPRPERTFCNLPLWSYSCLDIPARPANRNRTRSRLSNGFSSTPPPGQTNPHSLKRTDRHEM